MMQVEMQVSGPGGKTHALALRWDPADPASHARAVLTLRNMADMAAECARELAQGVGRVGDTGPTVVVR